MRPISPAVSALRPVRRAACLVVVSALSLAGCSIGDDENESQRGGVLRMGYAAQPDSLDPARSFSLEGLALLWTVYTAPLTYRHTDDRGGAELVPGLAEEMPSVSSDGLTYRFRFRDGLRYSNGTRLRASDFERNVKRVLSVESPGARFFLGIEGAQKFVERGRGDIAGITADDRTGEVTIRLTGPDGTFPNALASVFAAPVAAPAPARDLTRSPPSGIGAFRIARVVPNRRVVLVRNERLPELPNVPEARLDRVEVQVGVSPRRQAQQIIRNKLDFMLDPVPADMLPEVRREYEDRYEEHVSNSTFYFWLNSQIPPFDNRELRRAVHTALDKPALSRLYGGLMQPTCNFLPPNLPGHEPIDPCPYGDPNANGDIAKAKTIVETEKAEGTAVNVWGIDVEPSRQVSEAFADRLTQIGLKPKLKILSGEVYFETIGNSNTRGLHAGFANWFQEFPHPASFMAAVRGDQIPATGNYNFSHTNIPALTARIQQLQREPLDNDNLDSWAALDRQVIQDAGIVPYGHLRYPTLVSDRLDLDRCPTYHPIYITDHTRTCTE